MNGDRAQGGWLVADTAAMKPLLFLIFAALPALCHAGADDQNYGNVFIDEVTSVYDGDTFRANIEDWPPVIGNRIGIRINGIDTPELRGKCQKEKALARKAKQATVEALRGAKRIELKNITRGKYFRVVDDVYADGRNIGETLLRKGLAVRYDGGRKTQDWCR